jgi:hypothetical protein
MVLAAINVSFTVPKFIYSKNNISNNTTGIITIRRLVAR